MTTSLTERLVNRLAGRRSAVDNRAATAERAAVAQGGAAATLTVAPSRRGFLAAATLGGAALAVQPWDFITKPTSAYASVCGPDSACSAGYSAFCCTINGGRNTCPPNTYPGGWWKADRSSYCGGSARYYIDCNANPGYHFDCHCANNGTCDHRLVACNVFRYGQCNTQVKGTTAVVCRQISCRPPWQVYPGHCGTSSATDNNTAGHTAPCLTHDNTFPKLVTFAKRDHLLHGDQNLWSGWRLVSLNRHTECVMQKDGNLVVRNQDGIVWSSHTGAVAAGGHALLQRSGNLVIHKKGGGIVWQTHTAGALSHWRLNMRDSGDLVIEDATDTSRTRWHSRTHTP